MTDESAPPRTPPPAKNSIQATTVIVVNENPKSRDAIAAILQQHGAVVLQASDVESALQQARAERERAAKAAPTPRATTDAVRARPPLRGGYPRPVAPVPPEQERREVQGIHRCPECSSSAVHRTGAPWWLLGAVINAWLGRQRYACDHCETLFYDRPLARR